MEEFIAVKTWFDSLGWLANLLGIGGPIVGLGFLTYKSRNLVFGIASFKALNESVIEPKWLGIASIRSIVEIAIVDDNPNDFPISELKKAGYHVKTFKQISLNDLKSLAEFDVVFLDMHGIVKDDMDEGGLKLLPKLRSANPRQKICAVSSKTFDPTATSFFKQADDVQKKPISAQKCQEVIEVLANEKLRPSTLAAFLDNETRHLRSHKRRVLVSQTKTFANSKKHVKEIGNQIPAAGILNISLNRAFIDYTRVLRYALN